MAQIGCLGDIIFTVTHDKIETINNVQWSGSVRYSEHKRHNNHARTEFIGIDADQLSFDMYLSAYLGVDPMSELVKLWEYERNGTTLPLVIGEKAYGKYRWVITDHKITMENYDGQGNLLSATVSVSLLEYLNV